MMNKVPEILIRIIADLAMETLLQEVKPVMEKHTGVKLSPELALMQEYIKTETS